MTLRSGLGKEAAAFDAAACLSLATPPAQYACLEAGMSIVASTICVDGEFVDLS